MIQLLFKLTAPQTKMIYRENHHLYLTLIYSQVLPMLFLHVCICSLIYSSNAETGNYNIIRQTRTLLNTTDVNIVVAISGLIPDSSYTVQVLGYNTKGSLLSNEQNIIMPNGSKL